jgi:predicted permease
MTHQGFHENLKRDEVAESSDRAFGIVFAVAFSVLALLPLLGRESPRWWAFILASVSLMTALFLPDVLRPFKRAWLKLGLLMHKVVNPVVMGLLFFVVITPAALIMKVIRRDALHRRPDPAARSYWVARESPATDPSAMRNQF